MNEGHSLLYCLPGQASLEGLNKYSWFMLGVAVSIWDLDLSYSSDLGSLQQFAICIFLFVIQYFMQTFLKAKQLQMFTK